MSNPTSATLVARPVRGGGIADPAPSPGGERAHVCPITAANLDALRDSGALDNPTAARLAALRSSRPRTQSANRNDQVLAPLVIAGLGDGRKLLSTYESTRRSESGGIFRRRLIIVHEHEESLAEALSGVDLTPVIRDAAVEWFLGAGAIERLRQWLTEHQDDALPKEIEPAQDDQRTQRLCQRVARMLKEADARQQASASASISAAREVALSQSPLERRAKFEAARKGDAGLRVLVCGSVYTTYVRHSVEDLASEMRRLGHDAAVLTERDCSSRLTAVNYARAITEHRPDLVVLVNYTRSMLNNALPEGIPCITWIQDSMSQFFDPKIGAAISESDMIAGNTLPELIDRFGYPSHAAMPFCVPASAIKFHTEPVNDTLASKYACEIAFVSHHSESPEQMRERFAYELGNTPESSRLIDALYDKAIELVARCGGESTKQLAGRMCADAFDAVHGRAPDANQCSVLEHSVLLPLAGRMFRHEALAWAADIAESRGWRMRLFGNGWDQSERFARYAAGPIEHGEPLRACYQSASVHLHLDINTLTHQRVSECALSGGLPIARFNHDALAALQNTVLDELLDTATPVETKDDGSRVFNTADSPLAAQLNRQRASLGLPELESLAAPPGQRAIGRFYRERTAPPFDAARIFGDLSQMTFRSRESLERLLARAIDAREWRDQRSQAIREGVLRTTSTGVFATRLIEHAARVIGWRESREHHGQAWPPNEQQAAEYRGLVEEQLDA